MKKKHKLLRGLIDAGSYASEGPLKGKQSFVPDINVREIREKLNLSQSSFAIRYGFQIGTLRNWEQGRRKPEGSARVLLEVIRVRPDAVEEALHVRNQVMREALKSQIATLDAGFRVLSFGPKCTHVLIDNSKSAPARPKPIKEPKRESPSRQKKEKLMRAHSARTEKVMA